MPPGEWENPDCAYQLVMGKCEERKQLMDGYCYKTCGICHVKPELSPEGLPLVNAAVNPCAEQDCSWTAEWSCPGSVVEGTKGVASDDGTVGFNCCCALSKEPDDIKSIVAQIKAAGDSVTNKTAAASQQTSP